MNNKTRTLRPGGPGGPGSPEAPGGPCTQHNIFPEHYSKFPVLLI